MSGKPISERFAEGLFFKEIGICGLVLTKDTDESTWIALVRSIEGQLFFRSEKSRDRVLQELLSSIRPAATSKRQGTLVGLPIGVTATAIRDASRLIGVEVIERYRLIKVVGAISAKIDVAILTMSREDRKTYNSAFKEARIEAQRNGTKMRPYAWWIVDQVGSLVQLGAMNKDNFSTFLPAETGT
jgi:hypothetical protein